MYPEGQKAIKDSEKKHRENLRKTRKFLLEFVAGMIHLGAVLPLGFLGRPKPQRTYAHITSHPHPVFHGCGQNELHHGTAAAKGTS